MIDDQEWFTISQWLLMIGGFWTMVNQWSEAGSSMADDGATSNPIFG